MQPLFTLHAGECLVGAEIERQMQESECLRSGERYGY